MNFLGFLFPIVYTALFGFAVLFLFTTPNNKFYPKILFTVFVCSLATWGWSEILSNSITLRAYIFQINELGFFAAEISVQTLLLIALQVAGFTFKKTWLISLLLLVSLQTFIPHFIMDGFTDKHTYIDLFPGFGDMLYNTQLILFLVITFFVFLLSYKQQNHITRKRINPVLIAFIFSAAVGIFFNILLPEVYNDERFTSPSPLCVVSIVIALAYSIYKWNLLGITIQNSASYSQINALWKTKSPGVYLSIREAYLACQKNLPTNTPIKRLIFPGGVVNKKGNVYLCGQGFIQLVFNYYKMVHLCSKNTLLFISDADHLNYVVVFEKPIQGEQKEFEKMLLSRFSPIALYQKSTENIYQSHILREEGRRII